MSDKVYKIQFSGSAYVDTKGKANTSCIRSCHFLNLLIALPTCLICVTCLVVNMKVAKVQKLLLVEVLVVVTSFKLRFA